MTHEESDAVKLAKDHLEGVNGESIDAYFKVTKEGTGFSVHVEYVTAYDEEGQPIFIPGGHCTVFLSQEGNVEDVLPGA